MGHQPLTTNEVEAASRPLLGGAASARLLEAKHRNQVFAVGEQAIFKAYLCDGAAARQARKVAALRFLEGRGLPVPQLLGHGVLPKRSGGVPWTLETRVVAGHVRPSRAELDTPQGWEFHRALGRWLPVLHAFEGSPALAPGTPMGRPRWPRTCCPEPGRPRPEGRTPRRPTGAAAPRRAGAGPARAGYLPGRLAVGLDAHVEYRPAAYTPAPGENEFTWYSSHNPTPTQNLVFDSWHSGGLQAIDVSDPGLPTQTGWFSATRCQPWPMRTRPCPAGRTRS
jgi:hypothetical protein